MNNQTIKVLTWNESGDERAVLPSLRGTVARAVAISKDTLSNNMVEFVSDLAEMFSKLPPAGAYKATKIEVSASITTEGSVELIGKLAAGATGGIKVVFERSP